MDPRFLDFYLQELTHVRDGAAEFAARFPKVAGRLGMASTEVSDPYVERLLEGFAFLCARTQLRLHDEFPRFTEQLLDRVAPHMLAPQPAMGVVRFDPQPGDPAMKQGVEVPAGLALHSQVSKGVATPCKFRTLSRTVVWPMALSAVAHGPFNSAFPRQGMPATPLRSALTFQLAVSSQTTFCKLGLDALDLHVSASDEVAYRLYDRIVHGCVAVAARTGSDPVWQLLKGCEVQALGLDADDKPNNPQAPEPFSGLGLLQAFFALPSRFLFFRIVGLHPHLESIQGGSVELALCFSTPNPMLDSAVRDDSLALNCVPVVNLFEQDCDRVIIDPNVHELQVVPNRTRPLDFEIHSIQSVKAHGMHAHVQLVPLHHTAPAADVNSPRYSVHRLPARLSEQRLREGGRSAYVGSHVFLGLSQSHFQIQAQTQVQQLSVRALCTNRDLPLLMPLGQGDTDLFWPGQLPLKSIRFVRGPSKPRQAVATGKAAWHLIEHLGLNYLGLVGSNPEEAALRMRSLLGLFADPGQPGQGEASLAVCAVRSKTEARRTVLHGRPVVLRGVALELEMDEEATPGMGLGILGGILARCLARQVSVNSFVVVRVRGIRSGHAIEFPPMAGHRPLL